MLTSLLALTLTAAPADCDKRVAALETWLKTAAAARDLGATMGGNATGLATLELKKTDAPPNPAMALGVSKNGVRDGTHPERPLNEVAPLIGANPNIQWAKSNANAIFLGVVVEAQADAPAASVKTALQAVRKQGEKRAWISYRPKTSPLSAPPKSELTATLEKLGPDNVQGFVDIIRKEWGPCPGLMKMMSAMASSTQKTRFNTLISDPPAAVKGCKCAPTPERVGTILWHLGLKDLAINVPVSLEGDKMEKLPWGAPGAKWGDVAEAIAGAL